MRINRLIDLPKFGIYDIEHNNGKITIFASIKSCWIPMPYIILCLERMEAFQGKGDVECTGLQFQGPDQHEFASNRRDCLKSVAKRHK